MATLLIRSFADDYGHISSSGYHGDEWLIAKTIFNLSKRKVKFNDKIIANL